VLNVNGTGPVTATVSGNLIVMPTNGAGGRVGIGTTNPLTTVQVGAGNVLPAHAGGSYGSGTQDLSINKLSGESSLGVMVSDGTNNRRVKLFLDQTNGVAGIRQEAASGSVPFVYNLGGSELLRIATTGNVGIGTNNPTKALLQVGSQSVN